MDHKFLWCATSVVAKLMLPDDCKDLYTHTVSAVRTSIHENIYEYDVNIDNYLFKFKYIFDSNTFARGMLEIRQDEKLSILFVMRDMNGLKVHISGKEYIEFYSFNNRQMIGIRLIDNKKVSTSSLNIITDTIADKQEDYTFELVTACPEELCDDDIRLHMSLFAVNGIANKDYHYCYDVNTFSTKLLSMIIFSDSTGQVICVNTKLKKIGNEQLGTITVINSDFNQLYEYIYNLEKNMYFVEEIVKNRNNESIIKDKFSYREKKKSIYINEETEYHISTQNNNDIIFAKA